MRAGSVRHHKWAAAVPAVHCAEDTHVGAIGKLDVTRKLVSGDVAQHLLAGASATPSPPNMNEGELAIQNPLNKGAVRFAIATAHGLQHFATGHELGERQRVAPVGLLREATCNGIAFPARAVGYRSPNAGAGARERAGAPGLAHTSIPYRRDPGPRESAAAMTGCARVRAR